MSPTSAGTSANPPAAVTTEQAVIRARRMIVQASLLHHSAEKLANTQDRAARESAEQVKDYDLLNYQVATTPDVLLPVLEALISAVEATASTQQKS